MSSPIAESPIGAWIGLDWADQRHVLSLQAEGSTQVEAAVLDQTPEALQQWLSQLRARFVGRRVALALEQARGALLYALMTQDFLVLYPINPKSLAKFREALYPSGSKDDPNDAALLREFLQKHHQHLRAWEPDDSLTRQLRLLTEFRRQLVNARTRLTNQLTSLLKQYYPQALEWAGSLDTQQACDFLQRWPTLSALQKTTPGRLRKFYTRHSCRRSELINRRLQQIEAAQPLTTDEAVIAALSLRVQALVGQLQALRPALEQYDQQIESLFSQHPDHDLFASFPGAGPALAPRLLAAFGSQRARFQTAGEVQQLSGIAPVTKRSGRSLVVQRRWACPKFCLQTFHEYAGQSRLQCDWANDYYQQLRVRGKGHHAAIRALAFRWIRIQFRCWQARTPYDEQHYLAARARRQFKKLLPPLAASVGSQPERSGLPHIATRLPATVAAGPCVENL
jgi:transposase